MHLRFLHVFLWLGNSFIWALNNIPLSGHTTDDLSIHLLKYSWVTFKFGTSMSSFLRNCHSLPKWLHHFAFPPAMNKHPCGSTFLSALVIVSDLDFGHSNKSVVVSHYCLNLPFADDMWCGESFHMLFCIPSLVRCLLKPLAYFFNWVVALLLG